MIRKLIRKLLNSFEKIVYRRVKKKLNSMIGTELHFDRGTRHIVKVESFFSFLTNSKNLTIKFCTEDDYFYFTYLYNFKTVFRLLKVKGVKGYTRGDNEQDYIEFV